VEHLIEALHRLTLALEADVVERRNDRHLHNIEHKLDKIIMTQAEVTAQLNAATTAIAAIGTAVDSAVVEINKVGTETDASLKLITDLQNAINNQTDASPELVAAAAALATQVGVVAASAASAQTAIQAVDDKIPDPVTAAKKA